MLGLFLGLKLTVLVVFLSPILATLFALVFLFGGGSASSRETESVATVALPAEGWLMKEIPFGVFLGTSSLFALFFGEWVWNAYWGIFQ